MEFRFFSIFAMTLVVAVAARQVAVPEAAEMYYWTSVFPNTPMPKALPNLLPSSAAGNGMKAALADMGNGYNTDAVRFPFKYSPRPRISYRNAAAAAASNPANKDIFFFKSKLRTGINLDMKYLTMNATRTGFLPRKVADSIPFSSQDFAQVLNYFSLQPKSPKSEILKQTIDGCENPPIEGEEKYCVASFESFVDSAVSMLGKNIRLVSTELEKETHNQKFSIDEGVKLIGTSEIVCHKMEYPYAVFLCHSIDKTDVYRVPLVGEDGTRATALAVCHKDTSGWSPKHLAFQVLKVKPGTVPICHFLAKDTLVWIPN